MDRQCPGSLTRFSKTASERQRPLDMPRNGRRVFPLIALLATLAGSGSVEQLAEAQEPQDGARQTAIALNYCRASLYRIRRAGTREVMLEEQEKILNNLNLNGVADEQVVKLYTSLLDEIAQVEIAERERDVIAQHHKRVFRQKLAANVFQASSQLMLGQLASAARTGVSSWWDYRNIGQQRDAELWKVEKDRMRSVVDKSSQFLDAFWKLSRDKSIPDRWLIREDDLAQLDDAIHETDLDVRLRVLKRMERFMECYPPYWYYVARAEQQAGQLAQASETYSQLVSLGNGHFRKDDMLSAGLANRAIILHYQRDPRAPRTALEALQYSTDVWEANLMCAYVLQEHEQYPAAEDAVLRNLDVELETDMSSTALASLYVKSHAVAKLRERLQQPEFVQRVSPPVLLSSIAALGNDVPQALQHYVAGTLFAYTDLRFGGDDIVLRANPAWQLQHARVTLRLKNGRQAVAQVRASREAQEVRFVGIAELGTPLNRDVPPPAVAVTISYPQREPITLYLDGQGAAQASDPVLALGRRDRMTIAGFAVDERQIDLRMAGRRDRQSPAGAAIATPRPGPTSPVLTPASDPGSKPVELLPLEPVE